MQLSGDWIQFLAVEWYGWAGVSMMDVFDLCGDLRGGGKDDRAGVSGVEAKLGRRKGKDDGDW